MDDLQTLDALDRAGVRSCFRVPRRGGRRQVGNRRGGPCRKSPCLARRGRPLVHRGIPATVPRHPFDQAPEGGHP